MLRARHSVTVPKAKTLCCAIQRHAMVRYCTVEFVMTGLPDLA